MQRMKEVKKENVAIRLPSAPQSFRKQPRWCCGSTVVVGTWLGKTWSSDEKLVATERGKVVKARSVLRTSEESSWIADCLIEITGEP